jgi:hypothetical protein
MKKNSFVQFIVYLILLSIFSACATSQCDCKNKGKYANRKSKVSLINSQKNTIFALEKNDISKTSY